MKGGPCHNGLKLQGSRKEGAKPACTERRSAGLEKKVMGEEGKEGYFFEEDAKKDTHGGELKAASYSIYLMGEREGALKREKGKIPIW